MTAAAFRATFTDWRLIKGRKVVQVVLEVPVELADQAYQVLGGMPNPAESVWCAVARLQTTKDGDAHSNVHPGLPERHDTPPAQHRTAEREKRSWNELSAAAQSGMRCNEMPFQRYLREHHPLMWTELARVMDDDKKIAAEIVRHICDVPTRADITPDNPKAMTAWTDLNNDYRLWMLVPA